MTKQGLLSRINAITAQLEDLFKEVVNNEIFNEQEWIDFENYLNEKSNVDFNELQKRINQTT